RQQAMGVMALRHALAWNVRVRKAVALHDSHQGEDVRERPGGEQPAHAGADHDRMLAISVHGHAPASFQPCLRQALCWYGRPEGRFWADSPFSITDLSTARRQ